MKNEFLRHIVATIDYRFKKSINNSKDDFADFNLDKGSRSPVEIINHMFNVLKTTRVVIEEDQIKKFSPEKLSLDAEIARFISELKNIDKILSEKEIDIEYSKKILQGPFSDILTHIGQISMLQRLNDNPIEGENFFSASIKTGLIQN